MLLCAVVLAPIVVGLSFPLQAELNGLWFLDFYGVLLVSCWIFSELGRNKVGGWLLVGISIVTFLSVGGLRYSYGISHGMHTFILLYLMMIAGSFLIAASLNVFGIANVLGKDDNRQRINLYV